MASRRAPPQSRHTQPVTRRVQEIKDCAQCDSNNAWEAIVAEGDVRLIQRLLTHVDGDEASRCACAAAAKDRLDILKLCFARPEYNINYHEMTSGGVRHVLCTAVGELVGHRLRFCGSAGIELIAFLLEQPGIDVNRLGGGRWQTPLYEAIRMGRGDVVNALLAHPWIKPCTFGGHLDGVSSILTVAQIHEGHHRDSFSNSPIDVQLLFRHPNFDSNARALDFYGTGVVPQGMTMLMHLVWEGGCGE